MFFSRNTVSGIPGTTVSGQGMMFSTFLMKNIFIDFPTPNLKYIFCSFWVKISCSLVANLIVARKYNGIVQIKPMKSIEFFDKIMQKSQFKIGVGKSMKIFFIRNVPNIIPWPLTVVSVIPLTMFLRKTMKNSCFFMLVHYCRDSYCKCINYSIGRSEQIWAWRERWLWRDLFSRPLGVGSSASSMLRLWWFVSSL